MLTEINGNLYLNEQSITILMADAVRDYICSQDLILTGPNLNRIHAENVVEAFKKSWSRPQDDSNKDLHDMYRSVPDAIQWASDRERERRDAADYQKRVDNLINSIVNPEEYPDDDEWDAIHNEEDL